jgi:PKD repeat protein
VLHRGSVVDREIQIHPTDGTYTVELTYTFDTFSDTDTVEVEATDPEVVADAGEDQDVETGALVTLDGSGSTPAGGTFAWAFRATPKDSTATLLGADTANPSFTPDEDGRYEVELTYTVNNTFSDTDKVDVKAED